VQDAIVWEAPERCPGPAVVRAQVTRLLAKSERHPEFHARADVRTTDDGQAFVMHLSVTVGEAVGERELEETSCDALAEAAATIIALAVDPEGVERPARTPATRVAPLILAPVAPTPSPPPAAELPTEGGGEPSAPSEPVATRAMVGISGAGEAGLLPGFVPFVGLSGAIRRGENAFALWGALAPTQTFRAAAASGRGADVSAVALGAAVCRHVLGLPIGPCGGVSVVRIAGGGFGAGIAPRTNAGVIARAEVGGEAVWEAGFLGVRASAFATIPFTRPSFVVVEGESLFRPSAVGLRTEVGAFARF
jgi:hypothetical protein